MKFFFDIYQEIFCNNNYNTIIKITGILNEKIREIRKEFINKVKEKMNKELEIKEILLKINYIKDNYDDDYSEKYKKYINSDDIIQEDSREYTKSIITNQSKRNSLSSISNKNSFKNIKSLKKKQRIITDKLQNKNSFYINKINKGILKEINNKRIEKYINMNINVNINLNNNNYIQESFNSSLDSEEIEEDEKNEYEQYEMDLNEKNKIIITPIITNTNDNYNQTKSIDNSKNSDDNNNDIGEIE